MPKKHEVDQLNQGAMFQPSVYDREAILPEDRQFKPAESPAAETYPSVDIAERNRLMMRALGTLGVVAETAPATDIDSKPDLKRKFMRQFGGDYESKITDMQASNTRAQEQFKSIFGKMWGSEAIKGTDAAKDPAIRAGFTEDRSEFGAKFSPSADTSTEKAAKNRAKLRYRLRKQERVYREHNVGVWPTQTRKRRGKN